MIGLRLALASSQRTVIGGSGRGRERESLGARWGSRDPVRVPRLLNSISSTTSTSPADCLYLAADKGRVNFFETFSFVLTLTAEPPGSSLTAGDDDSEGDH